MLFSTPKHPLYYVAKNLRLDLLDMIYQSGGGHIGGSLSSIDIITAIYYSNVFNFSPKKNLKNDYFILSAGHLCTALYTVLANCAYFDKKLLSTYTSFNSILQGHVSTDVPGVEYSGGSLGQGLSFACGLALSNPKKKVLCLTSDGEHQEGQVWEAINFAKKYRLGNLINIIDLNGYQIDGSTQEIMPLGDLSSRYIQAGWSVYTVDGHDFKQLISVLSKANNLHYPTCIIAKTTLGKGVSFMENNFNYHDVKSLSPDIYLQAKNEILK